MLKPIRILLQTTIPHIEDDWNIERFSLLRDHLASITDDDGKKVFNVTARDRETNAAGNDVVLSSLDTSGFDELWLFAVDAGDGLTVADCEGIRAFDKEVAAFWLHAIIRIWVRRFAHSVELVARTSSILNILTQMSHVTSAMIKTLRISHGPTTIQAVTVTTSALTSSNQSTRCSRIPRTHPVPSNTFQRIHMKALSACLRARTLRV